MEARGPVRDVEDERPENERLAPTDASPVDVSVVIPCLDAAEVLPRQLEALANQEREGAWDVIVGDHGSTDDTRAIAESYAGRLPSLRVVDASERQGRQHACNAGARVAG